MNGKHERMKLVCRQSQILSHITELGQSMKRDPRDVILPFFRRISEKEYLNGFLQSVEEFKGRIQKRAVDKRKEMDAERAREERGEAPIGPGGLDPYEVGIRNIFSVYVLYGLRDRFWSLFQMIFVMHSNRKMFSVCRT
jgi:cell division cycle protein 37